MRENWFDSTAAGIDTQATEAGRQLMEETRLRDQSGEVNVIADVFVDPKATIFTQLSREPVIRYKNPRTRSSQKLGLRKGILRMLQAPADLKLGNVSAGIIKDAVVGTVYLGNEIGRLSESTLFVELITVRSDAGRDWEEQRLDYYVPADAITGYASHVVSAPQGN